jgi:eukaryotic-like serine/threonine-protein kinase
VWQHAGSDFPAGGPGIANGMVFIGTSRDLRVYDEATGTQLASWTTGGPIFGSPAIVNGRVYIGSTDGIFYVLTAAPR